jgi:hypothetical protein
VWTKPWTAVAHIDCRWLRVLALAWLVPIGAAPGAAEHHSVRPTRDGRLNAAAIGNNAFEMKVKGQTVLRWPYESVDAFKAAPRLPSRSTQDTQLRCRPTEP